MSSRVWALGAFGATSYMLYVVMRDLNENPPTLGNTYYGRSNDINNGKNNVDPDLDKIYNREKALSDVMFNTRGSSMSEIRKEIAEKRKKIADEYYEMQYQKALAKQQEEWAKEKDKEQKGS